MASAPRGRREAHRATRRRWYIALLASGLVLAIAGAIVKRGDILYYAQLLRSQIIGRRYVRRHPAMATDIAPHPNVATTLDVYGPEDASAAPVLVFVHGGSWSHYSKEDMTPVAALLVPEGYMVVIPNYTLYPDATYDQTANEVAAAVAWTLEHAADYHGDPERIYLAGHSAGGHLAALVFTEARWLAAYGHQTDELAGLIGMSGIYDLALQAAYSRSLWGTDELFAGLVGGWRNYEQASPITHVHPGLPPILLIHGTEDTTVPHEMSRSFCQALQDAGSPCELSLYPGAGHTDYLFHTLWGTDQRLLNDLERFTGMRASEASTRRHQARPADALIDQVVCRLYDPTPDEIALVERNP
ncbi:MAG: alpha/beta hydrolase [Anaerolineae bacterium]|nr:alpha/beta hydrolase [Anaerolineae bacterium]